MEECEIRIRRLEEELAAARKERESLRAECGRPVMLWIYDSGIIGTNRYTGPFVSESEALGHDPLDLKPGQPRPSSERILQCRRLHHSECSGSRAIAQAILRDVTAGAKNVVKNVPETIVIGAVAAKLSDGGRRSLAELLSWADRWIEITAYTCAAGGQRD
jgi:hypothetical protein